MNTPAIPNSTAEQAHQKALKLIYRHTHRDFKGQRDGTKEILTPRGLVALDDLTEYEVAERLPSALKKEAERLKTTAKGVAL